MNKQASVTSASEYQCGGRGGTSKRELPEGLLEGEEGAAEVEAVVEELPLLLE